MELYRPVCRQPEGAATVPGLPDTGEDRRQRGKAMLTQDQEIRAKALEIEAAFISKIGAAAIIAKRPAELSVWDEDLDSLVEYIRTGKKPEPEKEGS
jgi:hypothetical protein